ncbi:MAG: Thr-phospho decarboxylase, partial [Lachnospiraceae bacterium]|nr:Thr-phospho decarboxylase [Lachnospiraceae bacterium]
MLHGGDIYHNQVNMDFSMNVNPFGIPKSVRERMGQAVERIDTYPEPTAEKLRAKLAGYHKA